jgi:hypothetical protein
MVTAIGTNPSRQGQPQGSPLPRDEGGMEGERCLLSTQALHTTPTRGVATLRGLELVPNVIAQLKPLMGECLLCLQLVSDGLRRIDRDVVKDGRVDVRPGS